MRVLSIDPGYGRCGVSVVERKKGGATLLYSSCIITKSGSGFGERLVFVGDEILRIIKKYKPTELAIERLYFNTNQKTAMQVAETRGAILYIANSRNLKVYEYTPPQIKVAVVGWGGADKKQLMTMLPKLIFMKKLPKYDDEYDAIAIGITHLAHTPIK